MNAVLISSMASVGAAIGTVVAEGVVFAVQFWALRKEVLSAYQKVRYGTIVLALALAIASCLWVQMTSLGSFASLLVSIILFFAVFFAVYGGVLVLRKEPLAWQMAEKVSQMIFKKKENWVACHVSVMLSRPFVRACVGASQEGMISSIGKTFIIRKGNVVPLGTVIQLDFH